MHRSQNDSFRTSMMGCVHALSTATESIISTESFPLTLVLHTWFALGTVWAIRRVSNACVGYIINYSLVCPFLFLLFFLSTIFHSRYQWSSVKIVFACNFLNTDWPILPNIPKFSSRPVDAENGLKLDNRINLKEVMDILVRRVSPQIS